MSGYSPTIINCTSPRYAHVSAAPFKMGRDNGRGEQLYLLFLLWNDHYCVTQENESKQNPQREEREKATEMRTYHSETWRPEKGGKPISCFSCARPAPSAVAVVAASPLPTRRDELVPVDALNVSPAKWRIMTSHHGFARCRSSDGQHALTRRMFYGQRRRSYALSGKRRPLSLCVTFKVLRWILLWIPTTFFYQMAADVDRTSSGMAFALRYSLCTRSQNISHSLLMLHVFILDVLVLLTFHINTVYEYGFGIFHMLNIPEDKNTFL